MLLTEEQAKEKWCPFARVESAPLFRVGKDPSKGETVVGPLSQPCAVNRGGSGTHDEVSCIASQCMAWRWAGFFAGTADVKQAGYCGLAGQVS